eukprot:m.182908 g.182908  ORF g.182908 m.182908 type:complete len:103 (+) comp15536_c0_seq20:2235-2543(+)
MKYIMTFLRPVLKAWYSNTETGKEIPSIATSIVRTFFNLFGFIGGLCHQKPGSEQQWQPTVNALIEKLDIVINDVENGKIAVSYEGKSVYLLRTMSTICLKF